MYLTVKQQLKHLSKDEFLSLRELSHTAKNLYNKLYIMLDSSISKRKNI